MRDHARSVLEPTSYDIASYVMHLQNTLRAPGSVYNYLSGVRTWLRATGNDVAVFDSYHVTVMKKGITAAMNHLPHPAQPVHPSLVKAIVSKLDQYGNHTAVIKSALLLMFFTLLRQSNILVTSSKQDDSHVLRRSDVTRTRKALFVIIRTSKTSRSPQDVTRYIVPAIPRSNFCPVKAWDEYVDQNPLAASNEPAFQIGTRQPLTARVMLAVIRAVIKDIGHTDPDKFNLHGLRRGAAKACIKAGLPLSQLKEAGFWKSEAVFSYIPRNVNQAPRALATYFG